MSGRGEPGLWAYGILLEIDQIFPVCLNRKVNALTRLTLSTYFLALSCRTWDSPRFLGNLPAALAKDSALFYNPATQAQERTCGERHSLMPSDFRVWPSNRSGEA